MTVAENLYRSDPDTLLKIIVQYQLVDLARLYFKDILIEEDSPLTEEEANEREITSLMKPSTYTGKVERRRGAKTQPHRPCIK